MLIQNMDFIIVHQEEIKLLIIMGLHQQKQQHYIILTILQEIMDIMKQKVEVQVPAQDIRIIIVIHIELIQNVKKQALINIITIDAMQEEIFMMMTSIITTIIKVIHIQINIIIKEINVYQKLQKQENLVKEDVIVAIVAIVVIVVVIASILVQKEQ
jgi:hypothetical protein